VRGEIREKLSQALSKVDRPIPLKVATCVRKYLLGNDLSHQWRDILAFFASGMARMPRLNNRYNDRSHSPPSTCVTFIHCASYGASHEGWLQVGPALATVVSADIGCTMSDGTGE
jgi:hypothetical protein